MQKRLLVLVTVVLCLSSSALALIGHVQGYGINATNVVQQSGVGSARNVNVAQVGQRQATRLPFRYRPLVQEASGYLEQRANAVGGRRGSSKVEQDAAVWGLQGQLVGGRPSRFSAEGQILRAELGTVATSSGGPSSAKGKQQFVGGQTQKLATPAGWGTQSQSVGVAQNSLVETVPGGSGSATGNVEVTAGQLRIVTGPGPVASP